MIISNLYSRMEALEKGVVNEPITLKMPDGSTVTLRGAGDYAGNLLARAWRGERTREIELIAQSISSVEPGGAHMVDLARAILNSPTEEPR